MDLKKTLIKLIKQCTSCEVCHDEDIADHLIANGVTVQKWIPVTERLPEPGMHILVIENSRFPWLPERMKRYNMFVYNPKVYQPWMDYVTHWMPLPEPPKEVPK